MGCAEGRSPFAGSLRVPLRNNFYPLPGQEGGQAGWSKGYFSNLLEPTRDADWSRRGQQPKIYAERERAGLLLMISASLPRLGYLVCASQCSTASGQGCPDGSGSERRAALSL